MKEQIRSWPLGVAGVAMVIALWYLMVMLNLLRPGLVPTPYRVLSQMVEMVRTDQLILDVIAVCGACW